MTSEDCRGGKSAVAKPATPELENLGRPELAQARVYGFAATASFATRLFLICSTALNAIHHSP
jgi:hypothetical protein